MSYHADFEGGSAYKKTEQELTTDTIVNEVREDLNKRSLVGIKKYGVTLDRDDLSLYDWLNHAYEETLDKALYLKKAMKKIQQKT